ncbi:uncharacterized protein VTP21DRAFT_9070 [Calcarisporiella thermophila]|uniref:uncharacterized protein n=1 Tax=Calcarisporiella thermophila TaxID=911321 RepID=UPI003742CA03
MAALSEFKETLSSEVYVDIEKLRDSARHGIPAEVRRDVWKFLLGVEEADRSKELSHIKAKSEEYQQIDKENHEITKRVRGEVSRYQRRLNLPMTKEMSTIFERVICAYINHNRHIDYSPALISLCGPFVLTLQKESEIYYCFEKLMHILNDYSAAHSINERVANFVTLFRSTIPDLYSYFEEEEVDLNEWVTSWLQYLLSRELQMENLLRLWDTYFSTPDFLDFHPYVCLALLKHSKEHLEELEQSEIRTLLLRLPTLEIDQIINQAYNIRHEILERQISDGL